MFLSRLKVEGKAQERSPVGLMFIAHRCSRQQVEPFAYNSLVKKKKQLGFTIQVILLYLIQKGRCLGQDYCCSLNPEPRSLTTVLFSMGLHVSSVNLRFLRRPLLSRRIRFSLSCAPVSGKVQEEVKFQSLLRNELELWFAGGWEDIESIDSPKTLGYFILVWRERLELQFYLTSESHKPEPFTIFSRQFLWTVQLFQSRIHFHHFPP